MIDRWSVWVLDRFGRDPFGFGLYLGRALLALGTALTLFLNPSDILFHTASPDSQPAVQCSGLGAIGLFCIAPAGTLDALRIALGVACMPSLIGLLPAVSSWLHVAAAFSLSTNAIGIEGGDQLTVNLAILLAFASVCDRRLWAWREHRLPRTHLRFVSPNVLLLGARVQVSYVYFEAARVKLEHPIWREGSALWYWVQNSGFGVSRDTTSVLMDLFAVPLFTATATWGTILF